MNPDISQITHDAAYGGVILVFTASMVAADHTVRATTSLLRSYRTLLVQVRKAAEETARFYRWAKGRWNRR